MMALLVTGNHRTWPVRISSVLGIVYFIFAYLCTASKEQGLTWEDISSSNSEWEYRRDVRQKYGSPLLPEKRNFPKFYSPSMKLLVQRGDRVLLPCVVQDLGEDHILWRHHANIIAGSNIPTFFDDQGRIRLFENLTLEITNVSEADQGEYECLLASPSSSSLKLTHTVTVQDPPSVAVLPAKGSVVVIEGETVQIGCIPQGNPKPRITWIKKDGPIPAHHHKLFNESVITMEQVSRKHTGLYVCSADNGVGLPAIGAVYVRVLHAPEVEVPKRRVHGGIHYKAQLTCIVYADPNAEIKWFVGQRAVGVDNRIRTERKDKTHSLIIYSVRESDFGTYICTANNTYGHDLRHIEFSGVPNPPIVSRWETAQWPPPQSTLKNNSKNENKTADNLELSNGLQNDKPENSSESPPSVQADIQVQLFWAVECYSPLIDYRLAFRLAPTPEITAENEAHSPVWTELTIPADPSSTFLHTKSFVLRGLERERIYESAIKARNKYGWSPISSVFYFSSFPNSSSSSASNLTEILGGETIDGIWRPTFRHPAIFGGRKNDSWSESTSAAGIHFSMSSKQTLLTLACLVPYLVML